MARCLSRFSASAVGAMLALVSCVGVGAHGLDPVNAPLDQISVAIGVPDTVRLADGDATLTLALGSKDRNAAPLVQETVPLSLRRASIGGPRPTADDEIVYIARIPATEAARFTAAQAAIRDLRADARGGAGVVRVVLEGGCLIGEPPAGFPVSTWMQTGDGSEFVLLTRREDAYSALGRAGATALRARLRPCPE
ncbi:hypothetical protein FHS89_001165 [Rubricella aquisinus]|uniref:Uncharacterized protein n=1 Tax=Rubricella aquisinus TaxID=2028108 RepID=A0A840WZR4_9RHOB|nr:hypothetical protein [Rubricella aquisinus]MBB5515155.1 hypothetical protein [Rubricella aquisinus]